MNKDQLVDLLVHHGVKNSKAQANAGMFLRITDGDFFLKRQDYLLAIRRLVENREYNEGSLSFLKISNYFATINLFKSLGLLPNFGENEDDIKVENLEKMLNRQFTRPSYPNRKKSVDTFISEHLDIEDNEVTQILRKVEALTIAKRRGFDMEIAERIVKENL